MTIPEPWHLSHTFGTVPGLAPVPWQVVQASSLVIRSGRVAPSTACWNEMLASVSMSSPTVTWDGDTFAFVPKGENAPYGSKSSARFRLTSSGAATLTLNFFDAEGLGTWKRAVSAKEVRVTVWPDAPLDADDRSEIAEAAQRLAEFVERPLDLAFR